MSYDNFIRSNVCRILSAEGYGRAQCDRAAEAAIAAYRQSHNIRGLFSHVLDVARSSVGHPVPDRVPARQVASPEPAPFALQSPVGDYRADPIWRRACLYASHGDTAILSDWLRCMTLSNLEWLSRLLFLESRDSVRGSAEWRAAIVIRDAYDFEMTRRRS